MVSRAPWSAMASRVPGSTMERRPGGHLSGLQVPEASRAPTPPPRCYYYGASRAFREGEVMSRICLSVTLRTAPFPITAHALTWFHSSLIEHTCNQLPLPFISSLTSVTHRLILRLQGCMVAALYTGWCLPVYPGSGPCLRKRKFTNRWYCSSCFQNILRCHLCWKPCLGYS